MVIYFKEFIKIVTTGFKSISRKQKSKSLKMQQRIMQQKIEKQNKYLENKNNLYEIRQRLLQDQYEKELEDKLMAASQNPDMVNILQGIFNGII